MTDPAQATPEQMERARRIASGIAKGRGLPGARGATYGKAYTAALTAILQSDQQQAELLAHAEAMAGLLQRYRDETPSGHSPHMICDEADQALTAFRDALSRALKEQPPC